LFQRGTWTSAVIITNAIKCYIFCHSGLSRILFLTSRDKLYDSELIPDKQEQESEGLLTRMSDRVH
ncbi:MAG TPA: hypothetical protein DEP99_03185, partial [Nitrospiraceae bacterium]|nr:hypothetical protein [Nitrospiraceae bacterium]